MDALKSIMSAAEYAKTQTDKERMHNNGVVNLPQLSSKTKAGLFISSLNHSTDDKEIEQHVATDDEIANIPIQERYLLNLQSKTAETLRNELKGKKTGIQSLVDFIEPLMAMLSDTNFMN